MGEESDFKFKKEKAENLTKMLAEGGKIYVLHTLEDNALFGSRALRLFGTESTQRRLGASGAAGNGKLRDKFRGIVIDFDTTSFVRTNIIQRWTNFRNFVSHYYEFEDWAVQFYNDAHTLTDDEIN